MTDRISCLKLISLCKALDQQPQVVYSLRDASVGAEKNS